MIFYYLLPFLKLHKINKYTGIPQTNNLSQMVCELFGFTFSRIIKQNK